MLRTDSTCSALWRHAVVALTRRAARRERGRSSRRQQRAAQATEATEGTGLHRPIILHLKARSRSRQSRTISSEMLDMDSTRPA